MIGKVDSKLLDIGKPGKSSQRAQKVIRQCVLWIRRYRHAYLYIPKYTLVNDMCRQAPKKSAAEVGVLQGVASDGDLEQSEAAMTPVPQ